MPDTQIVLTAWRHWLVAQYSPRTVQGYMGAARRFLDFTEKPLLDTEEKDVVGWLETFQWRSSARTTYYVALKSLFGWCLRNRLIERDIIGAIRVPAPIEKTPRALTEAEYEAVLTAAFDRNPIHGYTVELLFHSAGRISEVCALRWEDVREDGLVFRKTKNGKERVVPMNPRLSRAVEGLREHFGEKVYILPRTPETVWEWVHKAGVRAGVEGVHPHLFRSTAATTAMKRGARANAVRIYLGHSKITTTQRYLADGIEDVQEVAALLDDARPEVPSLVSGLTLRTAEIVIPSHRAMLEGTTGQ